MTLNDTCERCGRTLLWVHGELACARTGCTRGAGGRSFLGEATDTAQFRVSPPKVSKARARVA